MSDFSKKHIPFLWLPPAPNILFFIAPPHIKLLFSVCAFLFIYFSKLITHIFFTHSRLSLV